jgi:hypothetical protein
MIRFLIKLAITALLANAAYQFGSEYLNYYKFKDSVRNAATFRKPKDTDEDLKLQIEDLAFGYDIPLDDDAIRVTSDDSRAVGRSVVEISYVKPVQVLPGYQYPFSFSFSVDTVYSKRF